MSVIMGIDLGTGSSACAVMDKGAVRHIPSPENGAATGKQFPSAVSFFADGGCLIGRAALEQLVYNPAGTVRGIKRRMGDGPIEIFGRSYRPQFISALLLMRMKVDAEKHLGKKVRRAVITVPASFDDIQRQATKEAGMIAGLDVLRLLPEPVAAAMAYGAGRAWQGRLLVFDMGAGTLDISIVEIDSGLYEVVATSGPADLGGMDMDSALAGWMLGQAGVEPTDQALAQVSSAAEDLKVALSSGETAAYDQAVDLKDGRKRVAGTVDRGTFDDLVRDITERAAGALEQTLRQAGLSAEQIDRVVLVGGAARTPCIRSMVASVLKEPESGADPDLAVATGAAIEAGILANEKDLPAVYGGITLLNVTPLDLAERARERGVEKPVVMIPKNTAYPAEHTQAFYVNKMMQTEVGIDVWQGDFSGGRGFESGVKIGAFVLSGLRPGRTNRVEVTYRIDSDGILEVSAREAGTGTSENLVIGRTADASPPPALGAAEEMERHEEEYRDTLSPYEIPVERQPPRRGGGMSWMCECLSAAKDILRQHHAFDQSFFDRSSFELFMQTDRRYAYAYIHLTGGPVYQIGIHAAYSEDTLENRRSLVVTLVHELLHAVHPDWGHNRINPEERRLANLAGFFDAYVEHDLMFLSGRMSACSSQPGGMPGGVLCP